MNATVVILALVALALGLAFLWAFMGWQKAKGALTSAHDRMALIEDSRATMGDLLKAQAAQSAQAIADQMVTRATETFQAQDRFARERIAAQLQPVAEQLTKFQEHVVALEKARVEETGGLKEQLAALMLASSATRDEARRLTEALKGNSGRRGRWGEQTLRNVLEAAGMAGRFDFTEQTSEAGDEGRQLRPDVIVKLPGGGMFVIDSKVSLSAFLDCQDGDDDARRASLMAAHSVSVKTHMRQLSAKAYQDQFKPSPDFTVMFVPGDAFLSAALDHEPELMTQAMEHRVVIVTPTTLFALCKAVAYGWRAEEQSKNAEEVARLGKELYKRLSAMGGHAAAVGKALDAAVGRYNQFVGSLESQVMVQARRFEDLHVDHEGRDLPGLTAIDQSPRAITRPELIAGDAVLERTGD